MPSGDIGRHHPTMPQSSFDRIAGLINKASLTPSTSVKVTYLLKVKELLIHRESSLLDSFFEDVVKFQRDPNSQVKKVVLSFIEEACRVDTDLLKRAVGGLFDLFSTAIQREPPSISLLKRLMSSMIPIYRTALSRAVKIGIIDSGVAIGSGIGITAHSTADIALETFRIIAGLKDELVRLMLPMEVSGTSLFSRYHHSPILHNDVLRIQAISLIECVIILHSRRLPNSEIPPANEGDISLDQIPALTDTQLKSILEESTAASSATLLPGVCLVRPHRLAEEAERLFAGLSSWPVRGKPSVTAGSITCPVVKAVMDSLVNIAKQRPQFMDRVVQAFETVHATLPPHFSHNQVSYLRKKLKNGLLQLLPHPEVVSNLQGRITILLTDLGATQAEALQALQSHTELSRSRLYPDPSKFMVSCTEPDHGDVDMRQELFHQQSIPQVTQASSSTVVFRTTHLSNIPPTDIKLSFSNSQSKGTRSTTTATPSTTPVTISTTLSSTDSAKVQIESTPSQKYVPTTSGGFTLAEALQALQSHTELSRSRLYPDPSKFMVSCTEPDHGDVDMRQELFHQQSIPQVTQASSSTVVFRTTHLSNIPPTDIKLSFSNSQSKGTRSTTTATPSTTPVTISTTLSSTDSAKVQIESTPSQKYVPTTSGGFTLAEAEVALQFDDDDEDDEDIEIPRSSIRLKKKNRLSSSFSNITGYLTHSGSENKLITSKTGSINVKSQVPEVELITSRIVPKLTTANVCDLVLLSMVSLPTQMPASFHSTCTPIAAAGTSTQIRHLARMLAVQLSVWATEGGLYEVADRIIELETLLIPVDDAVDDRGGSQSEPRTSEQGSDIQKESMKSKKRRLHMLNDQTSDENDPEAEDAVIRANAARKMHTAQTMNISTLVGYGKQQQQQMINESLDIKMLPPGVPSGMTPMFTGQNTMSLPPEMPPNMLMIGFNPSQPPPPLLMPMMMPPGMITPPAQTPSQASAAATSLRQQPTVMSGQATLGNVSFNQHTSSTIPMPQADLIVPSSVRPFSLDAVTAPLSRDVQRQLARDAFMRILDGLEAPYTRAQPAGAYLISGQYDVIRMDILVRLATRRFGGNEFYNILVDRAIKNLSYGFELLSKLLMQEYCRFRGFQLAGFSRFMDSRRHQLSVSREVRCKRLESSIENGCNNNNPNSCEKLSKADDNNKSMLSDTNGDAANTDASDNHEKTTEEDIRRQDMSTDEISHGGEKHKKKSNNTSDNTKRKLLDNSSMKPKCTDDEEPNEEEESDEDDAVADKADGDEETKSSLSNSSSLKDTPRRQSKKPKEEVSGDLKLSSKDKLSILKAPVAPPDDLGCLSFYDYIFIEVLQKLSNPEIRPRFLTEAPLITRGAINELKRYCSKPEQATYGFEILRTLIATRSIHLREDLLNMLLHFCSVDGLEVRKAALTATRELANYASRWRENIEMFAVQTLKKLLQPRPTPDIFPFLNHASIPSTWTDKACQACAHLFLGLMLESPSLMHKLAEVYTHASPDIKRCLLRMLDSPILRTLIATRSIHLREDLLNMLLHFCSVDGLEVRKAALTATRELANYASRWRENIEMFAVQTLKKLLQPRPTPDIFPFLNHASIPSTWTDKACQACAHLFLGLMLESPSLMHKLAEVYTHASPDIKRCLLRMLDSPRIHISKAIVEVLEHVPTPPRVPTPEDRMKPDTFVVCDGGDGDDGTAVKEENTTTQPGNNSPTSSGPGIPTRGEMSHHDTPSFIPAGMFNQPTTNIPVMNIDTTTSNGIDNQCHQIPGLKNPIQQAAGSYNPPSSQSNLLKATTATTSTTTTTTP